MSEHREDILLPVLAGVIFLSPSKDGYTPWEKMLQKGKYNSNR